MKDYGDGVEIDHLSEEQLFRLNLRILQRIRLLRQIKTKGLETEIRHYPVPDDKRKGFEGDFGLAGKRG